MSDLQGVAVRVPPQTAGERVAGAPLRAQAWLSEFERARWAAQPRYQGPLDMAAAPLADATTQSQQGEAASPHDHGEPMATRLSPLRVNTTASAQTNSKSAVNMPPRGEEAQRTPPQPFDRPIASAEARAGTARPLQRAQFEPPVGLTRRAEAQWSMRSVHAHVGEQSTAVWIRDAGISPQQAVRLLERLRPLLGTERFVTSHTIQLTVNGRLVEPDADRVLHSINYQERKNGY